MRSRHCLGNVTRSEGEFDLVHLQDFFFVKASMLYVGVGKY